MPEREPAASGAVDAIATARARAGLWLDKDYRRSSVRLFFLNVRKVIGWRALAVVATAPVLAAILTYSGVASPRGVFDILAALSGVAIVLLASNLYSDDVRRGSLELVWLASGSALSLLKMKITALVIAHAVLIAPAVAVAAWYVGPSFPVVTAWLFVAINGWLLASFTAWLGTLAPQGWIAGVAALVLAGAGFAALHDAVSPLNPFLNPLSMGPMLRAGGGAFQMQINPESIAAPNRILVIIAAVLIQRSAAKRLSRVLR